MSCKLRVYFLLLKGQILASGFFFTTLCKVLHTSWLHPIQKSPLSWKVFIPMIFLFWYNILMNNWLQRCSTVDIWLKALQKQSWRLVRFETLITIRTIEKLNSDNHGYLTINCGTGQHSQFLRCFFKLTLICRIFRILHSLHSIMPHWREPLYTQNSQHIPQCRLHNV